MPQNIKKMSNVVILYLFEVWINQKCMTLYISEWLNFKFAKPLSKASNQRFERFDRTSVIFKPSND